MKIKIHKNIFNEIYYPHLLDYSKRYEVYYGGAGSGKSVFVAQKLVIKALRDSRKILVLRKVNRTTKASTFQLLLDTLS
jgi:phage terminase large subunit